MISGKEDTSNEVYHSTGPSYPSPTNMLLFQTQVCYLNVYCVIV